MDGFSWEKRSKLTDDDVGSLHRLFIQGQNEERLSCQPNFGASTNIHKQSHILKKEMISILPNSSQNTTERRQSSLLNRQHSYDTGQ